MGNGPASLLDLDYDDEDDAASCASSWLSRGSSWDGSDDEAVAPARRETVIILDWDDTLMCSSELRTWRKKSSNPDPAELHELERAVAKLLRKAMQLGTTAIVTNAHVSWVRGTADIFMPAVSPLLDEVAFVVSARQSYGKKYPKDHYAWKRQAFRDVVGGKAKPGKAKPGKELERLPLNLLVLGDSYSEIRAGASALRARGRPGSIVKTVKFKEEPTVMELVGQLRAVARSLEDLSAEGESADRQLVEGGISGWILCDCGLRAQLMSLFI